MRRITFVHCADIHLDAPFISLGIKDGNSITPYTAKSSIRRMDLKNTFKKITEIAQAEGAGYLFISGDLYEHSYVRKSTINYVNGIFKNLDDIKVFIVPGNHDPWAKGSYYMNFEWADNVYILAGDKSRVCFEEEGICIYGPGAFPGVFAESGLQGTLQDSLQGGLQDNSQNSLQGAFTVLPDNNTGKAASRNIYSDKSINRHFVNQEPVNPGFINILLLHGTLDMNIAQDTYNPISSKKLESLGMDYIALGHFHKRMDGIGSLGIIYNPGSPEPLGFDEPGEHGVYVGSIVKKGNAKKTLDIKFKVTNAKRYEVLRIDISGCVTEEEIMARINDAIDKRANDGIACEALLLSLVLCGYNEPQFNVDMEYILSCLEDKVFYARVENQAVPDYDFDEIKKEAGIKGLFTKKMLDLIGATKSDYERELLVKALYYGIQSIEEEKVNISF